MTYIFAFLIACIPTVVHVWNDARGDNRKINDLIVLTLIAGVLASVNRLVFDIQILRSLALMAGIHILLFDYTIVYFLRKNGVIKASAKVFEYTGSKGIDKYFWSRVSPGARVGIRIVVFGLALYVWYA